MCWSHIWCSAVQTVTVKQHLYWLGWTRGAWLCRPMQETGPRYRLTIHAWVPLQAWAGASKPAEGKCKKEVVLIAWSPTFVVKVQSIYSIEMAHLHCGTRGELICKADLAVLWCYVHREGKGLHHRTTSICQQKSGLMKYSTYGWRTGRGVWLTECMSGNSPWQPPFPHPSTPPSWLPMHEGPYSICSEPSPFSSDKGSSVRLRDHVRQGPLG